MFPAKSFSCHRGTKTIGEEGHDNIVLFEYPKPETLNPESETLNPKSWCRCHWPSEALLQHSSCEGDLCTDVVPPEGWECWKTRDRDAVEGLHSQLRIQGLLSCMSWLA